MSIPDYWRSRKSRLRFEATSCSNCGKIHFPPKKICMDCSSEKQDVLQLSGNGKVISWTIIRDPPAGFEKQIPYAFAVVELEEGPQLTAQLTDIALDKITEGMEVEFAFRKLYDLGLDSIIIYGPKFRPRGHPSH